MALSTYAELKSAVKSWLDRSTDAALDPSDFITLAESRLNRSLALRAMETDSALTATIGSRSLGLPADFVEPKALFLTSFGAEERLRPFLAGTEPFVIAAGTPTAWTIGGASIDLDRPADIAHSFRFRYRQSFALSDEAPANWLLSNHPDAYLFAALIEANVFLGDSEAAVAWEMRLGQSLAEIAAKEGRSKSRAGLMVDPMLAGGAGFSMSRGE